MQRKINPDNVKKGARIILLTPLPIGFGNSFPLKESSRGTVTTNGFEDGILKVRFLDQSGMGINTRFNGDSAQKYLSVLIL
jgi:hypothetical protein